MTRYSGRAPAEHARQSSQAADGTMGIEAYLLGELREMTSIRVEQVPFESDDPSPGSPFAHCREIRRVVFTEGQGVPLDLEFDGLDADAVHFLASSIEPDRAIPLGVARMRRIDRIAKAERVAVLESARRRGVGVALMDAIEGYARGLDLEEIVLHAQVSVLEFYTGLGYVAYGERFMEADIDHQRMRKSLRSSAPRDD
jgi:predicted GNAT family N-acyltransferase